LTLQAEAWRFVTDDPRVSFAVLVLLLAAPLLVARVKGSPAAWPLHARWYGRVVVVLPACAGLLLAARYLWSARPVIEGVDFYYYVVTARDCLHGVPPARFDFYVYFPGVYRIWEAAMAAFGEGTEVLQWTAVGFLVGNAILVGAIVARILCRPVVGVAASLWYLLLASKLEALKGMVEPVATLFALAGILAWSGQPLRGRAGLVRALALGAALGLAAWTKQQGGLVAFGVGALFVATLVMPRGQRHSFLHLAAVPVASLVVFMATIMSEGEGIAPLTIGLGRVRTYVAEGSLWQNLGMMVAGCGMAGWVASLAALFWFATLAIPRLRAIHREPWMAVVGFSVVAGLATLLQFSKREYLHYALLTAPFMAIAAVILLERASARIASRWPGASVLASCALCYALALPLIAPNPGPGHFHVWPVTEDSGVNKQALWHDKPAITADIRSARAIIRPTDQVLVLPQRRNVVHLLLETRSPTYRWGGREPLEVLRSPELRFVLVLDESVLDVTDAATWKAQRTDEAVAALEDQGFASVMELKTMTIWRRADQEE
jgi:hypothetical protein